MRRITLKRLQEIGEIGDRFALGVNPNLNQGGAVSGTNNLTSFVSPDTQALQTPDQVIVPNTTTSSSMSPVDLTMKQIAPFSPYTPQAGDDFNKDVKQIKYKVTPDDLICAIDYTMKKQVLKDREVAKQEVVANLKKDPTYYSSLKMLGIDDGDSEKQNNVDPSLSIQSEDYRTPQEKAIGSIIHEMWKIKKLRRNWS